MNYRAYDPQRDREAVRRIWREIGWLKKDKGEEEAMDLIVECGRALVADIAGAAECLVTTAPGEVRYLDQDLPFSCVTGVATSRVARKQGLAKRLTARAVAAAAGEGALVSGLGMFEQGYYNQVGFGAGSYEHWISFDPAQLTVRERARAPRRVTPDDWEKAHAARRARRRGHGGCSLIPADLTRAEMRWSENGFGLGYGEEDLTHLLWCRAEDVESGPYTVEWMVFQTPDQFLELMALLRNLGDQVRLVKMREPQGIQLQDLLERPFRNRTVTEKSRFEAQMHASAYWQMRLCDLEACLARTHLRREEVRFNLHLADPIESILEGEDAWRGVSGSYVVTLGPTSGAERGTDLSLPSLRASVGAFTRLWLGVRPASGLAVTDDLSGPPELLEALDWALRLPEPKPDWDF